MNDVYAAPSADLTNDEKGDIFVFSRFSTWYVIGLTIITLSMYIPYWLYTRTARLNSIAENKISDLFVNLTLAIYVLTLAISIGVEFIEIADNIAIALSIADIVSNILVLVWVFKFRNRLSDIYFSEPIELGPIMTFFFQIFYLQYKINEIFDYKVSVEQDA